MGAHCHVSLPTLAALLVSWSNTQIWHILLLRALCLQKLLLCLECTAKAKITYCTFQSTAFSVAWIVSSTISPGGEKEKKSNPLYSWVSSSLLLSWDWSCDELLMGIIPIQSWGSRESTHSEALPLGRAIPTYTSHTRIRAAEGKS